VSIIIIIIIIIMLDHMASPASKAFNKSRPCHLMSFNTWIPSLVSDSGSWKRRDA